MKKQTIIKGLSKCQGLSFHLKSEVSLIALFYTITLLQKYQPHDFKEYDKTCFEIFMLILLSISLLIYFRPTRCLNYSILGIYLAAA